MTKKAEQTEKINNSSWISKRGDNTRQATLPQIEETDKQIQGVTEQRHGRRNHHGNQHQGRETCTVIDELLEAQCRKLQWPGHGGGSTTLWDLPLGSPPDPHSKYQKEQNKTKPKIPRASCRGGKMNQSNLFFLARPVLSRNWLTKT